VFAQVTPSASRLTLAQEWSSLGLEMGKALEKLELAKSRALNRLRAMVVEHADMIQKNAELIDEIDLSSSFAQAAVDLRLTRPVLDEG
jgi:DNA mismatch repair ATPase MutS